MPALEKNHIYRSTIEGYSSEGLGVARIDGQGGFVHDAGRGEDKPLKINDHAMDAMRYFCMEVFGRHSPQFVSIGGK